MLPWWFWFFPGAIFTIIAGIPLWGYLLKKTDRRP
jgi:hypothetical protein